MRCPTGQGGLNLYPALPGARRRSTIKNSDKWQLTVTNWLPGVVTYPETVPLFGLIRTKDIPMGFAAAFRLFFIVGGVGFPTFEKMLFAKNSVSVYIIRLEEKP